MQKILRKSTGSITWYVPESEAHTLEGKLLELNDPAWEEAVSIHKKGRRKVFASLSTTTGGEEIYLKAFRLTSLPLKLKCLFSSSKAVRELVTGLTALERGVPAVAPVAAGEKRRMGLVVECYVLLKKIDSAVNLRDYLNREDIPRRQRSRVIETLGRLARKSHESGIFQTDFSLNNFLLKDPDDPVPVICLIDFERTYVRDRLSDDMRNWTLAKLNRVRADFTATDRLRFLKAYLAEDDMDKQPLLQRMRALDRSTCWILRKDALRIHNACVRGGRGYGRYTNGPLSAYFLENNCGIEELIRLMKNADKDLENAGATQTPGPFLFHKTCSKIRSGDVEVDVYKFLPSGSGSAGTGLAAGAWRAANALTKANLPVSPVIGAVETGEGTSYRDYLFIRHIAALKDLRTAVEESLSCPGKKRALLWHAARFLARLHNHGVLSANLSAGDIGILELPSGRINVYLMSPFKFKMALTMTMDGTDTEDRELDLNRLEEFLGDLLQENDVELLRKFYRLHSSNIPVTHGETPYSYTPGRWSIFRSP